MTGNDTQAVVHAVLGEALAPTGATAAAVWAAARDGSLTLAAQEGFGAAEAAHWRRVPPAVGTWAQRALAEDRTLWIAEPGDVPPPTIGRGTGGRRAILPARARGRRVGALEIRWPPAADPGPEPTPALRRQLEALADLCAVTLGDTAGTPTGPPAVWLTGMVDGLLDSAMLLVPLRDAQGQVTDFLIEYTNEHFTDPAGRPRGALTGLPLTQAYPAFAAPGGLGERIRHVHATGEPQRTETALPNAPADATASVGLSRFGDAVLVTWRLRRHDTGLTELLRHTQRLSGIGAFEENLTTGEITWSEQLYALHGRPAGSAPFPLHQLGAHVHPDDTHAVRRFLRTVLRGKEDSAATFRLQRADGVVRHVRVVAEPVCDDAGALVAVRGAYQDVSSQHWTQVALAATRDRLAGAEQQAAENDRLTRQLQQAIMPFAYQPVHTADVRVAVRYRPAEEDSRVGGDWYDAVLLPGKQVLIAVGDVAGHGIAAANGMVLLRNALRGLAVTGAGPGQWLSWLNAVAYGMTENVTATVVCGLFDPAARTLCWARAGHHPPVLVRRGTAEPVPVPHGLLLGAVADTSYEERRLTLEPHDTLLMFTDGLIERRDLGVEEALQQFLTVASRPVDDLDAFLDHLLDEAGADTDDDTCLIGIQPM